MTAHFRALTIAGSDSGGGAGIQADLKTFSAFGVYGMSAVTALTAQNTIGVSAVHEIPIDFIAKQIDAVVTDIGVDAIKIGMLGTASIVEMVASKVKEYKLKPLVLDPVMISKSGHPLLAPDARAALREFLLPLADVVTPNLMEAEALIGKPVKDLPSMREAARIFSQWGPGWVVMKGGHLEGGEEAIDLLYDGREFTEFRAKRIATKNTHGTGCTFSAAITAGLARQLAPRDAIALAKRYVTRAIESSLAIGKGHGPTHHGVDVQSPWAQASS